MAYEVLARKWRPRQFDEVVGQEHVTRTLKNAIRTQRVAHAYLFVGPRGIGKTSIARIFAKALNCETGAVETPCDRCAACREIAAGSSLDVQEIDGASNRGIDEIRTLRDTVKYRPAGRHKIYIIDEVHMLTTEAFNALLKTLEEPPDYIKFFFATTEPQKIPATILSRCQRFDLRRIPIKLLQERLAQIARAEGVAIDDDALLALARAAEGGLRDAESALDQMIAFQGREIREADVLSVFGLISREALTRMADALLRGDLPAVIRLVEEFDRHGKDMQRLMVEMLEHFRNLIVFMQLPNGEAEWDLGGVPAEVFQAQAALTHVDRLLRICDILMETMDRLRYALSKKTLLETALIRCARAATVASLDEVMAQLRALREGGGGAPSAVGASAASPRAAGEGMVSAPHPPLFPEKTAAVAAPAAATPADGLSVLRRDWSALVERAGRLDLMAKSLLQDAAPVAVDGDRVTIGVDPQFAERLEQAQAPRTHLAVQKAVGDALRRAVTVEFKKMDRPAHGAPVGAPAQATENQPSPAAVPPADLHGKRKWLANEVVQQALTLFNGSIVDIKE